MTTAKLFTNGRSQAVRIPKGFRLQGDQRGFGSKGGRQAHPGANQEVVDKSCNCRKSGQRLHGGTSRLDGCR